MYAVGGPVWYLTLSIILAFFFFWRVFKTIFDHPKMFSKKKWMHAITGLTHLLWLQGGLLHASGIIHFNPIVCLIYDSTLGFLGIGLTLTAARDFPHKGIQNVASGTLDEHATVTYGEMIEHSFYQGLNLVQIIYFHSINRDVDIFLRLVRCFLATLPWLLRGYFPVNHFSDNYNKIDEKSTPLIRFMYRIKKYQYIFYKHFLLHGLNMSLAVSGAQIARLQYFRIYWVLLNASYVMEFFLQTLVKKKYMKQDTLLMLQTVLMVASSIAAVGILNHVYIALALISLFLNFAFRQQDVLNISVLLLLIGTSTYLDQNMMHNI